MTDSIIIDMATQLRKSGMAEFQTMNHKLTALARQATQTLAADDAAAIASWISCAINNIGFIRQTQPAEYHGDMNQLERQLRGLLGTFGEIARHAERPVEISQVVLRLLAVAFDNATRLIFDWLQWFEAPTRPFYFQLKLEPRDRDGLNTMAQEHDLRRAIR
ncbi:MAG: hypothetical protein QM523_00545 [Candidatus Pacebacteria bacterium]|nr:hypothetical protein [Candidatus Paceibacterota bacterium]